MRHLAILFLVPIAYALQLDEDSVLLIRIPDEDRYETSVKRAIPFSGGMYGKRSVMPFSGGVYGKRAGNEKIYTQRRAAIPFSGGMYGKRSAPLMEDERQLKRAVIPFNGGMYGKRSVRINRAAMPFSGGVYGR